MPFANLKVPADTLTPESKKKLIDAVTDAVTDAYADVYGERARATTLVLLEEVPDGGWGLGGNILTAEMLGRS
ncbi:tautomerase family protein [Nonomuraea sp. NPDC051941]|uniref:tautomerase family protein n=1 Tax=Nonomuraea sp. NPDC051941 TaxID=3364373 RepID=UPI0037C94FEC